MGGRPSKTTIVAAFAAVYVIWGSTYLGIRVAIETLPPFLMAGFRFLVAGSLLYGWARLRARAPRPTRTEWRHAWIIGGFLLLGGNGGVVWAQQYVPSGLAALLVATVPLFMVLLDWLWAGGHRPDGGVLAGLALGFGGVVLLVGAPGSAPGAMGIVGGVVILCAALFWATGSIYSRRVPSAATPRLGTAMQMLAGGALLTVAGVVTGEPAQVALETVSLRSVLALTYLIVFGSLIAFSAYVWLLRVSTAARVSTYAYVNPAVALFLGWSLAGEPVSSRMLLGSFVVLTAVMLVTFRGGARAPTPGPNPRLARGVGVST